MYYSDDRWVGWMDRLAQNDFVIVDDFISDELYENIMLFFHEMEESDKL